MKNRWSDSAAAAFQKQYGRFDRDLVLRAYSGRLLGDDPMLVLHGGGNTSLKSMITDITGTRIPALFVKPSGGDLGKLTPDHYVCLDLAYLQRLSTLKEMSDEAMAEIFRIHMLRSSPALPSVEALVHACIPHTFIDHTHPEAILVLTNQRNGAAAVKQALGDDVVVLPYKRAGFDLARQVADALESHPDCTALVLSNHGLITWGSTAKEAYSATIDLVSRAEKFITKKATRALAVNKTTSIAVARARYEQLAPIIRGKLARKSGSGDDAHLRVILRPVITDEALAFVDSRVGKTLAAGGPLTPDHIIRTKSLPLWIDKPSFTDRNVFSEQLAQALDTYAGEYEGYIGRQSGKTKPECVDPLPSVILIPGLGAVCAGWDIQAAEIAKDITEQTIRAKTQTAKLGALYQGPTEKSLYEMEFHPFQTAKIRRPPAGQVQGKTALVTGAAGAIGSGIAHALCSAGFHVALTDLPGPGLDSLVKAFVDEFGARVIGVPMDVTSQESVGKGFGQIISTWGGVDLIIPNAGIAHVAALSELDPDAFRKLEKVNVEGTLLVIAEAARHFKRQATGGDIILVSTKNVFAPGARFGAYSATKAAAHQLARIASLELADIDVRVNMVAPDAVFSHGATRSGLWAAVGPDRMKARGLDEKGLEEYYRSRNLLKARITAEHVGRAVLFFATRQTPTTGATIPVDGGLPDAVPR